MGVGEPERKKWFEELPEELRSVEGAKWVEATMRAILQSRS
jgi:hypothetical protein